MKQIPPMRKARTEMLPLMDMIFLLLVIFIFMIVQMRPGFGINVDLPATSESAIPLESETETITISVTAENQIFIDETNCDIDSLIRKLKDQKVKCKEHLSIILRGDSGARYGDIMKVFSACRENEISSIIFDFEQE